jgi:hypothetical protein
VDTTDHLVEESLVDVAEAAVLGLRSKTGQENIHGF